MATISAFLRDARFRTSSAALVLLVGFVSCLQGRPPSVVPQHVLGLGEEPPASGSKAPFGIVFSGPHGKTDERAQVSLLFNRPMRALELAGAESPAPAKVTTAAGAAVDGAWRWLGTSALAFAPKSPLPSARFMKTRASLVDSFTTVRSIQPSWSRSVADAP